MEEIFSFITNHWVEWLFAGATFVLARCDRNISAQLQLERKRNEAIAAGVESLLRNSIVSDYNKYLDKGCCPIYAKESIKRVYQAYHTLGGNDIATELYNKLLRMPEQEDDHDE